MHIASVKLDISYLRYSNQMFKNKEHARAVMPSLLRPVWPERNCQMSIKGAQNDFTRKIKDFDTFAKIA